MATRRVEFHPEAAKEAKAARQWYFDHDLGFADAFVGELDHAMEMITQAPHRWPEYIEGTRRYLMRRFPYFVVYHVQESTLTILAVVHARRKPGYWRSRQ